MVVVKVTVHPQGLGPTEAAKAWYSASFTDREREREGEKEWGKEGGGGKGQIIMKLRVHEGGGENEVAPDPEESKEPRKENTPK